jgi:NAD(P)-dependent dehydrogenase (short-subunit alcohol dehydrogenase family)
MLVVGASSGIGREIAVQASHAGARVALCARRPELLDAAVAESRVSSAHASSARDSSARASSARAFRCDVTDENDVCRSVEEASSWMGGLDVVVYAAGTAPLGGVAELDASDWTRMLATMS